ncbi:restriction endonuclease subunit S [Xanthobacter flavus]|uniref:restriction endonuclease subunit S n=1 Tax=Xanthobacter flavus TaxID=281 RepID=UPI001AE134EC|nr:restriction endonuclease subunit S [Xanthobacter flavus]MBP2150107.1 type I restriction enzyme S subunit [Xanthobacter flavus]
MSRKAYPSNKDSGIEWLGCVPDHWWVYRLKRLATLVTEKAEAQTAPVALENIEGWTGRFRPSETQYEGDGIAFKAGDILFGKLRPYLAKVFLCQLSGEAVGDFHVLRPASDMAGRFLQYLMLTREFIVIVDGSTYGAKMPRASWDFMGQMELPKPPLPEQRAIAAFLDRETAKIDALVAEQERLIALLAEKRRAVISHAVTKGLDPNAPMKDSGIAWLGEIPAHWEVKQLRRIVAAIEQGWSPECLSRPAEDLEWGVLKAGCTNGGLFSEQENKALPPELAPVIAYEVRPGDILMSRANGSPKFVGSTAYVSAVRARLLLSDKIYRVRLAPDEAPEWFVALMGATIMRDQIVQAISGAEGLANNLPQSSLKEFLVPVPPRDEQFAISKHIAIQTAKLDTLTSEAERAIALLKERRAALISAAVTGKIDVRDAVAAEEVAA